MNIKNIPICMLLLGAACLAACAPKPKSSDAAIAAVANKLSNSVSVDEYAKCAATYGLSYNVAKEKNATSAADKAIVTSTIYFTKTVQLSSNEVAAKKMTDANKQYWQIKQEKGDVVYLQTLNDDLKHCDDIASNSLKN